MSTQKGNTQRSRPQKYKNTFAFKNSLHDTSHKTKAINNLQITNVCKRCKNILEWKIKYKKYKPLKAAGKCNKCEQKTIRHSYHTMCIPCAKEHNICPKCGEMNKLVATQPSKKESLKLDGEMQKMLKTLPERKRRTFIRYMNKHTPTEKKKGKKQTDNELNCEVTDDEEDNKSGDEESEKATHETLLNKLKILMNEKDEDDDFSSDLSDSSNLEE